MPYDQLLKQTNYTFINFEVDEAGDGNIAVDQFKKNQENYCEDENCIQGYKLIIMDLGMPYKDGFMASRDIYKM